MQRKFRCSLLSRNKKRERRRTSSVTISPAPLFRLTRAEIMRGIRRKRRGRGEEEMAKKIRLYMCVHSSPQSLGHVRLACGWYASYISRRLCDHHLKMSSCVYADEPPPCTSPKKKKKDLPLCLIQFYSCLRTYIKGAKFSDRSQ